MYWGDIPRLTIGCLAALAWPISLVSRSGRLMACIVFVFAAPQFFLTAGNNFDIRLCIPVIASFIVGVGAAVECLSESIKGKDLEWTKE